MHVPDFTDRSVKTFCPFGEFYHADRGVEAAFRVYPEPNNAYCFGACGFFSPVSLYAAAQGISQGAAADSLLQQVGWKPPSLEERWAEALAATTTPDVLALAEALKAYCSRVIPGWEFAQFEKPYSEVLDKCLSLLPRVSTDEDATAWLNAYNDNASLMFKLNLAGLWSAATENRSMQLDFLGPMATAWWPVVTRRSPLM